ncbi:hypothetical protein NHX12_029871 [Muraenolepis orangiensis]|uniref:Uncharacterized protein n=1 Tax=Muraenolepis orangiensis TaxID=630683 RepID=A0A9Q0IIW6_9TELE|nr:hypothetical protein NHX12_029871 [Muraenolepis orangiensis]
MESVQVQSSQWSTALTNDQLTNQDASTHTSVGHHPAAGATTFSELLVDEMGKLGLNVTQQTKTNTKQEEQSPRPSSSVLRSLASSGADSHEAPQRKEGRAMQSDGMASQAKWAYIPSWDNSLSSGSGIFMSETELQSQMCEFCHAIFPGQTATRGEFLRHLYTHIN